MNIFRLAGDMSHLFAILYLPYKIVRNRSSAGISGKSQILYLIVFVCRYLDLFTNFISLYNTLLKILFIVATAATIFLIYFKFPDTGADDDEQDSRSSTIITKKSTIFSFVTGLCRFFTGRNAATAAAAVPTVVKGPVAAPPSKSPHHLQLARVRFASESSHRDKFRVEILVFPCALLALGVNHEFTAMEVLWTYSIYLEAVAILPQLFMLDRSGLAESITGHYLFALGSYRGFYILNWIYRYAYEAYYDLIAIVAGCVQTLIYCDFFHLYCTRVVLPAGNRLAATVPYEPLWSAHDDLEDDLVNEKATVT